MSGDYEVGYGRPPKRTQWKNGQTGNRGRRKARRAATNAETIDELLLAPVAITKKGCPRPILQTRSFVEVTSGAGSARPHLMRRRLSQLSLPFTVSLLPADWRTKKPIGLGSKKRPTAAFAARGGELGAASLGPFGGGFRIVALHQICVTGPASFPQAMCIR
jgi:hypothetical protein